MRLAGKARGSAWGGGGGTPHPLNPIGRAERIGEKGEGVPPPRKRERGEEGR